MWHFTSANMYGGTIFSEPKFLGGRNNQVFYLWCSATSIFSWDPCTVLAVDQIFGVVNGYYCYYTYLQISQLSPVKLGVHEQMYWFASYSGMQEPLFLQGNSHMDSEMKILMFSKCLRIVQNFSNLNKKNFFASMLFHFPNTCWSVKYS